ILVLVVGVVCGLVGAAYLLALHLLQHVLWPTEWSGAVGFAVLGGVGIAVALIGRFVGTPGDVELMVDNIHVSGTATGVRMLRSLAGYGVYVAATGAGLEPVWHLASPHSLHLGDLGWSVVAGVGGAVVAIAFTYATTALRWGARRLPPMLRPVCGGVLLAALG